MSVFDPMASGLQTERLSLRLRDERDLDVNLQLHEERITDPSPRRPWEPWPRERVRTALAGEGVAFRERGFGLLAIDRRVEGDTIGYCGLIVGHVGHVGADEPEIAYELLQAVHGLGYATEAGRAVVAAAWATRRSRLWSSVRPWNAASFAVLERLGFVRDHEFDDEWGASVMWRLDAAAG